MERDILKAQEWLKTQIEKDDKEIQNHKLKMIAEIKKIDKDNLYKSPKISLFRKFLNFIKTMIRG